MVRLVQAGVMIMCGAFTLAGCAGPSADPGDPPALPGQTPLPCAEPWTTTFQVRTSLVTTFNDGYDPDGDGLENDVVGSALDAIFAAYDDADDTYLRRLQERYLDDLVWVLQTSSCEGSSEARVAMGSGQWIDGELVLTSQAVPSTGTVQGNMSGAYGVWDAADGIGRVPLGALFDLTDAGVLGWQRGVATMIRLADNNSGEVAATIGLTLGEGADQTIAAALIPFLEGRLGGPDASWSAEIDANRDGAITEAELLGNALFADLIAPDLDMTAAHDSTTVVWPDHDGVLEGRSLTVRVVAVPIF